MAKPHRATMFDRCSVKDSVKLAVEANGAFKVEVYKGISGDSGVEYFIQVLRNQDRAVRHKDWIYLCDCFVGKFVQPAEILGLGHDIRCKHVKDLLEVIE